nr:hypothetical protein Iba_chr10aCG7900 [Ipomoea batatas]GME09609.1 hypothetical protein Iba_scaffold8916CG0040 [Ipomoea batatas]
MSSPDSQTAFVHDYECLEVDIGSFTLSSPDIVSPYLMLEPTLPLGHKAESGRKSDRPIEIDQNVVVDLTISSHLPD